MSVSEAFPQLSLAKFLRDRRLRLNPGTGTLGTHEQTLSIAFDACAQAHPVERVDGAAITAR